MAETPFHDKDIADLAIMTYKESDVDDLKIRVPGYKSRIAPAGNWLPEHGHYEGVGAREVTLTLTDDEIIATNIECA
jgi:hypothetical protein